MSNSMPPPPPPSSGFPSPPPVPPGNYQYGHPGSHPMVPQPPSAGLRKAVVILMWITTGSVFLSAFAAFNRKGVWDDFVDGSKTFTDLDDADAFIGTAFLFYFAVTLATAIVLAVWSNRVATNARAQGIAISPGLAAGGWFIPIGWYFVPFAQLRKALAGRGDTTSLGWWQGLWVVAMIGGGFASQMFDSDDSVIQADEVSSDLRNQSIGLFLAAVAYIGATVFAMRALRSIEAATSGV